MRLLFIIFLISILTAFAAKTKDHYQILGIARNADDKTIKKAYRKLAMKWHPDKHDGEKKEKAEKNFMRIAKAYETLSDPEKRRIYDQVGEEGVQQQEQRQQQGGGGGANNFNFQFGGGGGFDPFMIFEQMFGSRGFPSGQQQQQRGHHQQQQRGGGGAEFFSSSVKRITSDNAKTVIGKDIRLADGRVWTIMFMAPWCGHCQQTKPEFEKFAQKSKGVINVGYVDCDVDKKLCSHYRVQGFPTILSLLPDTSTPVPYQSARTADAFYEHSQRLIPTKFVNIVSNEEEAKTRCGKAKDVCIVLLSDKSSPTPLLKALAYRTKDFATTILVKVANPRQKTKSGTIVFGDEKTKVPALFINGVIYNGNLRMDDIYKSVLSQKGKKVKTKDQL